MGRRERGAFFIIRECGLFCEKGRIRRLDIVKANRGRREGSFGAVGDVSGHRDQRSFSGFSLRERLLEPKDVLASTVLSSGYRGAVVGEELLGRRGAFGGVDR